MLLTADVSFHCRCIMCIISLTLNCPVSTFISYSQSTLYNHNVRRLPILFKNHLKFLDIIFSESNLWCMDISSPKKSSPPKSSLPKAPQIKSSSAKSSPVPKTPQAQKLPSQKPPCPKAPYAKAPQPKSSPSKSPSAKKPPTQKPSCIILIGANFSGQNCYTEKVLSKNYAQTKHVIISEGTFH